MRRQELRGVDMAKGVAGAALDALHRQAEAIAAELRTCEPGLEVSVAMDAEGATLRIGGRGLAERLHGSSRSAPVGLPALAPLEGGSAGDVLVSVLGAR